MNPYFTPPSPISFEPKRKSIDDIPDRIKLGWALRLYGLGSLVWDYADTVLNYAQMLRIPETKKLSRAVKTIKVDYDHFRSKLLNNTYLQKEEGIGLALEELCTDHLKKLHYGLKAEIGKYRLSPDYVQMVESVQQCLTLIDTMKLYAKDCDKQVGNPRLHSILPDHFVSLGILIAEFAGDAYEPNSQVRAITARILYNELKALGLYDDDGNL